LVSPAPVPRFLTDGDLAATAARYLRHLRAINLTPATQRAYLDGLTSLARFLTDAGLPTDVAAITREHIEAFITDQLARLAPASAANRFSSLRPFFAWLVDEGEIPASPMARMRKPRVPDHAPPVLTDAELAAILRACDGPSFDERRDTALVRVFLSTGARLSEVANLRWTPSNPDTNDVDVEAGILRVMGKGRRERFALLSPKAVRALEAYLDLRDHHRFAAIPHLWLGLKGRMTGSGITQVLRRRGRAAGVDRLHPHLFRHTYAHQALSAGMQEGEVMALAGWRSHEMLSRYARSAERERAIAAARRLNVGDRL
jgi:site-specific recombinase XerD